MTKILEIRKQLQTFAGRYEMYILPAVRFVVALVAFFTINARIGYMQRLNSPAISIVLALICTFLPINATAVLAVVLILLHLCALSLDVCVVAVLLFVLMFFLYYKYAPKNGYNIVLTPVLSFLKIPEVVPTALGLTKGPYSCLSLVCGFITYYFLRSVKDNEVLLGAAAEEAEVSKITVVLQALLNNKEMYLLVVASVLTTLVMYIVRRQAVEHAWTIAVVAGNLVNLVVLLAGSFVFGKKENLVWMIVGTILAVLLGLLLEFFLFHLDYARTEQLQFEDDEYYYYVKAIPKVYVSQTEKQVKQINSRKESGISKKELADELEIDRELLED